MTSIFNRLSRAEIEHVGRSLAESVGRPTVEQRELPPPSLDVFSGGAASQSPQPLPRLEGGEANLMDAIQNLEMGSSISRNKAFDVSIGATAGKETGFEVKRNEDGSYTLSSYGKRQAGGGVSAQLKKPGVVDAEAGAKMQGQWPEKTEYRLNTAEDTVRAIQILENKPGAMSRGVVKAQEALGGVDLGFHYVQAQNEQFLKAHLSSTEKGAGANVEGRLGASALGNLSLEGFGQGFGFNREEFANGELSAHVRGFEVSGTWNAQAGLHVGGTLQGGASGGGNGKVTLRAEERTPVDAQGAPQRSQAEFSLTADYERVFHANADVTLGEELGAMGKSDKLGRNIQLELTGTRAALNKAGVSDALMRGDLAKLSEILGPDTEVTMTHSMLLNSDNRWALKLGVGVAGGKEFERRTETESVTGTLRELMPTFKEWTERNLSSVSVALEG